MEKIVIVGQLFCFVREVGNTCLSLLPLLLKKVNFQSRCSSPCLWELCLVL